MKLASLRRGGPDGTLTVVDRQLSQAVTATKVAPTLQAALDDWDKLAPALRDIYGRLNAGGIATAFRFRPEGMLAPLPRAFQWLDASAYVNHVALMRRARGVELPPRFWHDPLMYQGGSDAFLGPRESLVGLQREWGIDFEAEIAVVTDDVPIGIGPAAAGPHIKLLMLVNDVSLRALIPDELDKGFGFVHGKPSSAFSPVAVTPDELGEAFVHNKVHLPLRSSLNGTLFGRPDAGVDMTFDFATLIAHAAKTRRLAAGSIIGSGTVSNEDRAVGSSCIAERRVLELLDHGAASTPFMQPGDTVRIEMLDCDGRTVFGAIEQQVV